MADKWIQLMSNDGVHNLFPATKMDLLWENATPTTAFAAQTIQVDLSGYNWFIITFRNSKDASDSANYYMPFYKGRGFIMYTMAPKNNRKASSVTATSITFDASAGWDGGSTSNNNCIPIKIWGVKGV